MKMFIKYLKGIAVLFYHMIPTMLYGSSIYAFFQACVHVNGTAALWLVYGNISLIIAVTLTFIHCDRFFDVTFPTKDKQKATADKDKKNF